jgi:hypothetical protein
VYAPVVDRFPTKVLRFQRKTSAAWSMALISGSVVSLQGITTSSAHKTRAYDCIHIARESRAIHADG